MNSKSYENNDPISKIYESYILTKKSDIEMCVDFNKKLSGYEWGPVDKNYKPLTDEDFEEYRTLSPKDFYRLERGTCWDYVEAQREFYDDKNLPHSIYYLESDNPEKASHTITVIRLPDGFIWDEASWKSNKGVHKFQSLEDLLNIVCDKHATSDVDNIVVYKYPRPNKFGMGCEEFMDWVKNTGKLILKWEKSHE